MTLQIFPHFFHHKFVTSLQSTSLSSAASASAYGASEMRYSPRPDRALQTTSPIAVVAEPDRALRTSSSLAVVAEPDRALLTSSPIAVVRNPTARAVTLSVNPRQRRGTSAAADAPRSAAADALLPYIFSGTALRCISLSPL